MMRMMLFFMSTFPAFATQHFLGVLAGAVTSSVVGAVTSSVAGAVTSSVARAVTSLVAGAVTSSVSPHLAHLPDVCRCHFGVQRPSIHYQATP